MLDVGIAYTLVLAISQYRPGAGNGYGSVGPRVPGEAQAFPIFANREQEAARAGTYTGIGVRALPCAPATALAEVSTDTIVQ